MRTLERTPPLPPTTGPWKPRPPARTARSGRPVPQPAIRTTALHRLSFLVLVVGLVVTGALTVSSRLSYLHTEQRLSNLQTSLTASAAGRRPGGLGTPARSGGRGRRRSLRPRCDLPPGHCAVDGARGTVRHRIARSREQRAGPGTGARRSQTDQQSHRNGRLGLVRGSREVGFARHDQGGGQRSATTRLSDVVRGTGWNLCRLRRPSLTGDRRLVIPSSSPDAGLNVAIYFGRTTSAAALVETNVSHLPLTGTVSTAVVPFGSSVLTLVISPRAR